METKETKETKIKELNEIKASFEKLETKYKQIKASPEMEDKMKNEMMDMMYSALSNVYRYIGFLEDDLYKHTSSSTHLPPILGPGKMKAVLETLSMDDDYTCSPRQIFANKRDGTVIEIAYSKKS